MAKVLETKRLILREWEQHDADDLFEICSDKITNMYVIYPLYKSIDEATARIAYCRARYQKGIKCGDIDYAIELKSENKVIGSFSLTGYSTTADGVVEVGYQLNSKYFGKGYAPEMLKTVIKYVFKNNIASRIFAKHDVENINSGKVMKKANMTFEGILRKCISNNKNHRADCALYSILKEEI